MARFLRRPLILCKAFLLCLTVRVSAQQGYKNPHRPECKTQKCSAIRAFVAGNYCPGSHFEPPQEFRCDPQPPKPGPLVRVVATQTWEDDASGRSPHQRGSVPPLIRNAVLQQLRRLGQPAKEDRWTYYTIWATVTPGWTFVEALHWRGDGETNVSVAHVLLAISGKGMPIVLRSYPYRIRYIGDMDLTTWSLEGFADADGDGQPDLILTGDGYEDHWLEVFSLRTAVPRMIFSGLGYSL